MTVPEKGSKENPDIDGFYLFDVVLALKRMGIHIDERRLLKELFNPPKDQA